MGRESVDYRRRRQRRMMNHEGPPPVRCSKIRRDAGRIGVSFAQRRPPLAFESRFPGDGVCGSDREAHHTVPVVDDKGQRGGEEQIGGNVDVSDQSPVGVEGRCIATFEARRKGDLVADVEVGRRGVANIQNRPRTLTNAA